MNRISGLEEQLVGSYMVQGAHVLCCVLWCKKASGCVLDFNLPSGTLDQIALTKEVIPQE